MNDHHTGIREHYPAARRDYRPLVGLVSVAVGLVALVLLVSTLRDTFDPLRRQQAAEQAYQERERADRLRWADDMAAAGWRLLPLALVAGAGSVGLLLVYRRWATNETIRAYHVTQALAAQRQPVPQQLHYAPSYSQKHDAPALRAAGEHTPALMNANVPTFAQLLDGHKLGAGHPLLLGFDAETGESLEGGWTDLYSTIVSGLPGTGKTTSQRFLACQTALHGAQFVIVDPHAGAGADSLAETLAPLHSVFLCAPASQDADILNAVQLVASIGARRVAGDRARTPVILWLDETTALLNRSTIAGPLSLLIEGIAQEYRKVGVFCAASGQVWTANRTGDSSALRDSFSSVISHRMKRSQARLLLPTDEAEQVERLATGQAVLWRTSGATNVITVPNTTARDVQRVAALLANPGHTHMPERSQKVAYDMPDDMPKVSQKVANDEQAYTAAGRGTVASPEAARAAALFLGGMDPSALVLELRGVKSSQGKTYQTALSEVMTLLREGMAR